jgi:hypothetical protein
VQAAEAVDEEADFILHCFMFFGSSVFRPRADSGSQVPSECL